VTEFPLLTISSSLVSFFPSTCFPLGSNVFSLFSLPAGSCDGTAILSATRLSTPSGRWLSAMTQGSCLACRKGVYVNVSDSYGLARVYDPRGQEIDFGVCKGVLWRDIAARPSCGMWPEDVWYVTKVTIQPCPHPARADEAWLAERRARSAVHTHGTTPSRMTRQGSLAMKRCI
jgi:hypothetical protein